MEGKPILETVFEHSHLTVEDIWELLLPSVPSLNLVSGFRTRVSGMKLLLDTSQAGSEQIPILDQKSFIGCISRQSLRKALEPLDDNLEIVLATKTGDLLQIRPIDMETAHMYSPDFGVGEEHVQGAITQVALHHPAVFECCSTLSSILEYFRKSDVDYICATRYGSSWAVVTREVMTEWVTPCSS